MLLELCFFNELSKISLVEQYLLCILQAESFYGVKNWYEVRLQKKIKTQNAQQRGSGSNFNSNNLFLDLVENFDEASKNEANWTVVSWIKLKLEKATWSCYFILWLPWLFPDEMSRSVMFGNSLNLRLLNYCLYTIIFVTQLNKPMLWNQSDC